MDDSRTILAIGRIEQAIGRLERAARGPTAGSLALTARHERLRRAASEALRELDRLLGREG